mgnify:CR=1 FL=1
MENRAHALIAGLFVVLLGLATAVAVWWLGQKTQDVRYYLLEARQNVTGLNMHAQVRYRGIRAGRVESIDLDERERLVRDLGSQDAMILRNHGLLVAGPDLATTFWLTWTLQRACEVQMVTDAMAGPNAPVSDAVAQGCVRDAAAFDPKVAQLVFEGALRRHGVSVADLAY